MHKYTLIGNIPEHVQAKINAMNLSEVRIHSKHCCCFSETIKHMHKQLNFHIKLLKVEFFIYIVTLQRVLEKDQRWWLQVALGCYSIPSSQIFCRNPQ